MLTHAPVRTTSATVPLVLTACLTVWMQAAPAKAAPAKAPSDAAPPQRVTLITGDVVTLPGGDHPNLLIRARDPRGDARFTSTTGADGDRYVVPRDAAPHLDSVLDRSLFDVTRLARSKTPLKVDVSYRTGAKARRLPGIAADGTVTSPKAFGTALAKDAALAKGARLLDGVARIAVAGTAAPPTVHPNYVMWTVSLQGIWPDGATSGSGEVHLYNIDDSRRFARTYISLDAGTKLSVPDGNYFALAEFDEPNETRFVALPQVAVHGDTTLTLDARTATQKIEIDTPKPSQKAGAVVNFARTDGATGATTGLIYDGQLPADDVYIAPTSTAPTIGKLYYSIYSRRVPAGSPAGSHDFPYTYDLSFAGEGTLPASEHYTVGDGDLATVTASYRALPTGGDLADDWPTAWTYWQGPLNFPTVSPQFLLTADRTRTEYMLARPDLSWAHYVAAATDGSHYIDWFQSGFTSYSPGQTDDTTWFGEPVTPRLFERRRYPGALTCPACRNGDTVSLLIYPFGDGDPDHLGLHDSEHASASSYRLYAGGTLVKSADGVTSLTDTVTMPSGADSYRFVFDTDRNWAPYTLSTHVHSEWTYHEQGTEWGLVPGWTCADGSTDCEVLPLLTGAFHLPVDARGRLASGTVQAGVTVGNVENIPLAITSLTVEVSFDGGTTWQPAGVTGYKPDYSLSFTVPPAAQTNGYGALRITARDSGSDTFTQTITNAFAVAS